MLNGRQKVLSIRCKRDVNGANSRCVQYRVILLIHVIRSVQRWWIALTFGRITADLRSFVISTTTSFFRITKENAVIKMIDYCRSIVIQLRPYTSSLLGSHQSWHARPWGYETTRETHARRCIPCARRKCAYSCCISMMHVSKTMAAHFYITFRHKSYLYCHRIISSSFLGSFSSKRR